MDERSLTVNSPDLGAALATYASIADATPLPMSVLDPEGCILLWNAAAERVLGWRPEEVIGGPLPSIPDDQQSTFERQFQRALRGETVTGVESRCRRKDGQVLEVRVAAGPLRGPEGEIVGVVRTVEDVSDLKRAEESLQGQAALLNLTFDAVLVRDFSTDSIVFWNEGAEEMYGFTAAEAVGKISHDLLRTIHPAPADELKDILARTGRWEGEIVHTRRDGSQIVVTSRWALQSENNLPVAILETNTDITERKAAEVALRESEERYRTIIATANEGVWLIDLYARTLYANDRMAELLGYTPEELARRTVLDCLFPGDEPLAQERIGANLRGTPETFDFRFRRKDGSPILVLSCTSPVRDGQGRIMGALGMFTDITDRVAAEQERLHLLEREQRARAEVEESQQRLVFLAEASEVLASSLDYETTLGSVARLAVAHIADWCSIHVVDPDGTVRLVAITHPNPAMVELAQELEEKYPYDPEGVTGVPSVLRTGEPELIHEVSDEMLQSLDLDEETVQLVRDLGLRSSMTVPMVARGHVLGAISFVAAESGKLYDSRDMDLAQELARRAAMAVDNARLYREAQRTAAELSAILSQMADGVAIVDPTGQVTFLNAAARRLSGNHASRTSLTEAIMKFDVRTVEGQSYSIEDIPIMRALRNRETILDAQWRLRRPDGSEVFVQGTAAPLIGQNEELLGAVSTFRDITAQRTLEEQKDDFLSTAAHDLKTPLASLKGIAQLLQRRIVQGKVTHPRQLLEGLSRIEQNAARMASLVNELLDLTRLQMGQGLDLNLRQADLISLVARAVQEQRDAMARDHIVIETDLTELAGVWDVDRVDRVVSNLLSNAVKYSPGDTPIVIGIRRENREGQDYAAVAVQDQGIGIPLEDVPHIFERFHRARNVGRETMGTGIGLAGAKQIVEQHGGTIEVETQEGVGSTFTIRLPIGHVMP